MHTHAHFLCLSHVALFHTHIHTHTRFFKTYTSEEKRPHVKNFLTPYLGIMSEMFTKANLYLLGLTTRLYHSHYILLLVLSFFNLHLIT